MHLSHLRNKENPSYPTDHLPNLKPDPSLKSQPETSGLHPLRQSFQLPPPSPAGPPGKLSLLSCLTSTCLKTPA